MTTAARRVLVFAAVLSLVAAQRAAAAPIPATVLLVTDVAGDAQYMPRPLWRKLAAQYVNARSAGGADGATMPDDAQCRSARALYAVLARFERDADTPAAARDPARGYGVARLTVRDCVRGAVTEKTLRLASDPLSEPYRGEFADNAGEIWDRAVRTATERDPLVLRPVGRVVRLDGDAVVVESNGAFALNQVLRVFADADAAPYPSPPTLVVTDVAGKYVVATVNGGRAPRPGDYVDAVPR